jgi:hypothetical protein
MSKSPVFFVHEKDMGAVAMKAVEDPRTLNKILHLRPQGNLCSMNQLVSIWENKIGRTLEKTYVCEEELVKKVQGTVHSTTCLSNIQTGTCGTNCI